MDLEKIKAHFANLANGFSNIIGGGTQPTTPARVEPANVIAARLMAAQDTPLGAPAYAAGPLANPIVQPAVSVVPVSTAVAAAPVTSERTTALENQLNVLQARMAQRAAASTPALNAADRKQYVASVGGR